MKHSNVYLISVQWTKYYVIYDFEYDIFINIFSVFLRCQLKQTKIKLQVHIK